MLRTLRISRFALGCQSMLTEVCSAMCLAHHALFIIEDSNCL